MNQEIICEGWLTKLGFKSGKWQKRWCTLKGGDLLYSRTAYGPERGVLKLERSDVSCPKPGTALEVDAISVGRKVVGHGDYAFSVNAPWQNQRRTFYFVAPSPEELMRWFDKVSPLAARVFATPSEIYNSDNGLVEDGEYDNIPSSIPPPANRQNKPKKLEEPTPVRPLPEFPDPLVNSVSDTLAQQYLNSAKELILFCATELQRHHFPEDDQSIYGGWAVVQPPQSGSAAERCGLQLYDIIIGVDEVTVDKGSQERVLRLKQQRLVTRGQLTIHVYNFQTKESHRICATAKGTSVLGVSSCFFTRDEAPRKVEIF
eukprot:m.165958 g.165958  ORF g.165958 m.165958 type:complete len:316 (-) comp15269_c0_seq1:1926-2873(-)